jgi:hypothetical protein
MTDLTPHHRAPEEVKGPLVSTGMGRGLHTWIAVALTIAAIVLGLIARSFTTPTLALLFLAAGIGLLGEVPRLLRTGTVRARSGERIKADQFLIIRREDSPGRFYFYVITYAVLGTFSLLVGCSVFWFAFVRHGS